MERRRIQRSTDNQGGAAIPSSQCGVQATLPRAGRHQGYAEERMWKSGCVLQLCACDISKKDTATDPSAVLVWRWSRAGEEQGHCVMEFYLDILAMWL